VISWAAVDVATDELREERGDTQVPAASTIKLFVALAFWTSDLDPDETISVADLPPAGSAGVAEYLSPKATLTLGDLALLMLAVSDNAATNLLLARVGFDAVNAEIERLGLGQTAVRRLMMTDGPENLTSARDLARGLAAIARDELAGPPVLRALELAGDSVIPSRLGPAVRVHSKSGDLPDVRHEVALLDDGRRRVVTAVCSSPPVGPDALAARAVALWLGS
jgi:beta-lactamase class A